MGSAQLAARTGFLGENHHLRSKTLAAFPVPICVSYWPQQTSPAKRRKDNVIKTKLFTSQWTGKTARHFYLRRLKCFFKWRFVLFHNWNSAFAHGCCCTWNLKCLSEAHVVPICAPEWNYWNMVGTGAPGRSFGCYRYGWEVSLDSVLFFPSHEVRGLSLPLCRFLTTGLKAIG